MRFSLKPQTELNLDIDSISLFSDSSKIEHASLDQQQLEYAKEKLGEDQLVRFNLINKNLILLSEKDDFEHSEKWRLLGYKSFKILSKKKVNAIQVVTSDLSQVAIKAFLEGLILSSYAFDKYKSDAKNDQFSIQLISKTLSNDFCQEISSVCEAVMWSRDLVNEPANELNALDLSEAFAQMSDLNGIEIEVLHKAQIESLKMGGLIHVNKGSIDPPTFSILNYKPNDAVNQKPIILVGKGVVYDTGGLSLKPTPGSMDMMKCDMAGAAAVAGALYALAANKTPLWAITLVPATDNRPGGNALAPGDIISMHNGKSVEVLNTDAEGRLILADALSYAQKYEPELVIDLATLTGSALRAIGHHGAVFMGNAPESIKKDIAEVGFKTQERLVEFPFWDDYDSEIKSEVADINNLGGPNAGAITAGKFLAHFIDYDWLHIDIAGPAYLTKPTNYRGTGGTGYGVRLLYEFLKQRAHA